MVSKEEIEEMWKRVWDFWGAPRIPKPKVIKDEKEEPDEAIRKSLKEDAEFITYHDNQIYVNRKNVKDHLGESPKEGEEKEALEWLMAHGTGHYRRAPYDLVTKLVLLHNALKGLRTQGFDEQTALSVMPTVQNIYNDVLVNTHLVSEGKKEATINYYVKSCKRRETDPKWQNLPRKTWDVYIRLCEKLWNADKQILKDTKLSDEQERAAEKLYKLLEDNMYNKEKWSRQQHIFAQVLAPFIKEDGQQAQDMQMQLEKETSGAMNSLQQLIQQLQDIKNKEKDLEGKTEEEKKKSKEQLEKEKKQAQKELEKRLQGLPQQLGSKGNKLGDRKVLEDMRDIMAGLGVSNDTELADTWTYRSLAAQYSVKFLPIPRKTGEAYPFSPTRWTTTDPFQKLDIPGTLFKHGVLIPNVTTEKWEDREEIGFIEGERPPDLYIILDSSGSMDNPKNQIAPAVLAAFVAAESALNVGVKVAVKNFSGDEGGRRNLYTLKETDDKDEIAKALRTYYGGGTVLPTSDLENWIGNEHEPKQFLIITDTRFFNFEQAYPYIKSMMQKNLKNRGAIFVVGGSPDERVIKSLEEINFEIFNVNNHYDLFDIVVGKTKQVYGNEDES